MYRQRQFGRGNGQGKRRRRFHNSSPNCDFHPDKPRGWWKMPQYKSEAEKTLQEEIDTLEKELEKLKNQN